MTFVGLYVTTSGHLDQLELHYLQVESIVDITPSSVPGHTRIFTTMETSDEGKFYLVPYTMEEVIGILRALGQHARMFPTKQMMETVKG